jgi:DNA polymerase
MSLAEYTDHNNLARMVKTLIKSCNRCELGQGSNRVVYGGTTWRPKLILLGEAPGRQEDLMGEPFVGAAGKLLDDILAMVGLTRNHVMIANTVCCRPPGNRDPEWSEIQACRVNREAQLYLGKTWVGVSLGRIALGTLLEDPGKSIGAHKGKPFWRGDMVWVPTYHPAYGLRTKTAISEIASHIKLALDIYDGKREAPYPPTRDYKMEEGVLIIDHEAVRVPARILEAGWPVFTREEWARVSYTPEAKKAAIQLKLELDATVIG